MRQFGHETPDPIKLDKLKKVQNAALSIAMDLPDLINDQLRLIKLGRFTNTWIIEEVNRSGFAGGSNS
jgi:hypothetical protein